jgi:hypothetical protein
MFVRECYDWFYEQAIKTMSEMDSKGLRICPGLIYTGNPGIGKSTWLNYALMRFVQDGYGVVLERAARLLCVSGWEVHSQEAMAT